MSDHLHASCPEPKLILTADPGRVARARIDELATAFREVIESGWFILGKQAERLETAFSQWQQGEMHTIGVANGTDALELCLRACGVGAGDLVVVPTHTAVATATAVVRAGAEPLLLDVDSDSFNLDLDQVEEALSRPDLSNRIKAIVPVHLYGNPCDMSRVMSIAQSSGVIVIEDCSQAHGAKWLEKKVGCFGDAAAFSCYPTKNLGAIGDAGLCLTSSPKIAEVIRLLRQYGWRKRYISDEVGMNSRLDELQAALLLVQLKHLDRDLARRREIAARYGTELCNLPIKLPSVCPSATHAYHQFTIQVEAERREALRQHLQQHAIGSAVLYPSPIHRQPAYVESAAKYPFSRGQSETVCEKLLCLPMHAFLTDDETTKVIEAVQSFEG